MCDVQHSCTAPVEDLTFNVKLKPHEIEARKRLVLPQSSSTYKYVMLHFTNWISTDVFISAGDLLLVVKCAYS